MRSMFVTAIVICISSSFSVPAHAQWIGTNDPKREPLEVPQNSAVAEASGMFYWMAASHFQKGEYEDAIKDFDKVWELRQDVAVAYDLALSWWKLNSPYAARTWIRRMYDLCDSKRVHSRAKLVQVCGAAPVTLAEKVVAALNEDAEAMGLEPHFVVQRQRDARGTWHDSMAIVDEGRWRDLEKKLGRAEAERQLIAARSR